MKVPQGSIDLITLLIIFFGLQFWWIYPIFKQKISRNDKSKDLKNEIKVLERIYKK